MYGPGGAENEKNLVKFFLYSVLVIFSENDEAGIYTTIDASDGAPLPEDAHGLPVSFAVIPLFFSLAVFAGLRAIDDSRGGVLAGQILLAVFVFIIVTGIVPPL